MNQGNPQNIYFYSSNLRLHLEEKLLRENDLDAVSKEFRKCRDKLFATTAASLSGQ